MTKQPKRQATTNELTYESVASVPALTASITMRAVSSQRRTQEGGGVWSWRCRPSSVRHLADMALT